MRVGTAYFYSATIQSLTGKQSDIYHTQTQIATGRRIVSPSDDPIAATQVLQTAKAKSLSDAYLANIGAAKSKVKIESVTLEAVRELLLSAKGVAMGAAGAPSQQVRNDAATYLQSLYQNLLGYANAQDANGDYLFAGYKAGTKPFTQTSGPSVYVGDNNQQRIAIAPGRELEVTDPGSAVFGVGTPDDPFAVIAQFITDLQNNTLTGAAYETAVLNALNGLNNALATVTSFSNQVGNRYQELLQAEAASTQFSTQYANEVTRLEAVDLQKAAVELQMQQLSLQASQQAFVKTNELSLFNYI